MTPKEPIGGVEARNSPNLDPESNLTSSASGPTRGVSRPLLMVDIDGVISLFGGSAHAERGPVAGSFHSIEGIPHFLSATAATHLLALVSHFELVWASGWEEKANEHLPHLLGLPPALPYLRFSRSVGRSNAHWKLDAIGAYAAGRPLAWIDDAFNPACHAWASARAHPTLLVQTDPELGLMEREAQRLEAWARELEPA
jgi:HAD domain in Swiss Army Knife RNA repair proteins